ncbi:MAG: S-layer homology domain-containing protein [Clostridia bacterium]|nr:S-layer homology domain-containing protein [Clostridia bacterium]
MKKILAFILVMIMSVSTVAFAADFVDMPEDGHWSKSAIENAVKNGLLTGNGGYVFPENNMTRAEMATIMVRACGAIENADISAFTDVSIDDWYYSSMSKAVAMGAFTGSDNKLNPENYITRQEAFVVLSRVFGLENARVVDTSVLDAFLDKDKVADWAKKGVAAIIQNGYVGGAAGKINPTANITRAEFAVVMDRLVKYYIDDAETTEIPVDGNVMIRVGGLRLDRVATDKMVVIGDGVGDSQMVLSNANIEGVLVVRGAEKVSIDGAFADIRIIVPNLVVEGNPKNVKRVYVCEGSTYSMGNIMLGEADEKDVTEGTVLDAVDKITE